MIKLIATDMDGTLLDENSRLPKRTFAVIQALKNRGIVFAPASGRAAYTIRHQFDGIASKICAICDNGSTLMRFNEVVYHADMPISEMRRVINLSRTAQKLYPLICGLDNAYVIKSTFDDFFAKRLPMFFSDWREVETLEEAYSQDTPFKLSFQDGIDADTNGIIHFSAIADEFDILPSGFNWIDVVKKGENKGNGLRKLQGILGVSPDETMVFGDYLNDTTLYTAATETYAMKNAHPYIKEISKYTLDKTNGEEGVIEELIERFDLKL